MSEIIRNHDVTVADDSISIIGPGGKILRRLLEDEREETIRNISNRIGQIEPDHIEIDSSGAVIIKNPAAAVKAASIITTRVDDFLDGNCHCTQK